MLSLRLTFLFLLITTFLEAQKPVSLYFRGSTGKGHCALTLNQDSTYEQNISNCMYWFSTEGTYSKVADTITLVPTVYINRHGDGKKDVVSNTSSTGILANRMNKYFIKTDTSLAQLQSWEGKYKSTWSLVKQPLPKRKRR